MSIGQHTHTDHPNLEDHLTACEVVEHDYGTDYVHKHFAECLADDPSAEMLPVEEEESGMSLRTL